MTYDSRSKTKPTQLDALVEVAQEVGVPLSARQRASGWLRLQRSLAEGGAEGGVEGVGVAREGSFGWLPRRRLQFAVVFALLAAAIPVGRLLVRQVGPQDLQYVVIGASGSVGSHAVGSELSAAKGPAELRFTDGSRIVMLTLSRLTVSATTPLGSDVQLLDGRIDVDVQHRQAGTAWTFRAGPYTVQVKGTSFELGWDAKQGRFELTMREGSVAMTGPPGVEPRVVRGGEVILFEKGAFAASVGAVGQAEDRQRAPSPSPSPVAAVAVPLVASPRSGESSADRSGRNHKQRPSRRLREGSDWARMLVRGEFNAIVEQAERRGVDRCLRVDGEQDLAALADAARYTHRAGLARRSLVALRARFPGTERARDAAFFLARLSETHATGQEALSWYERYRREATGGSYAEEALGREMMLLQRNARTAEALGVAGRYVREYPHGVYSSHAAALLAGSPPAAPASSSHPSYPSASPHPAPRLSP